VTASPEPAKSWVLANLMEELVAGYLDEALEKFNCCKCDKCKNAPLPLRLIRFPPTSCGELEQFDPG
jgi:hypothetical protein